MPLSTAHGKNGPQPELACHSRTPRAQGADGGLCRGEPQPCWIPQGYQALQGPRRRALSSQCWAGASAHVLPGSHVPPTPLRGCSGQGGLGAPASQCPAGASTGHPHGSSIPGDPLITFSPFSPAPPSPTSTCGAERAVRANGVKHQPGGRDDREQSLQFVLGVREDPARRVRKGITWH